MGLQSVKTSKIFNRLSAAQIHAGSVNERERVENIVERRILRYDV